MSESEHIPTEKPERSAPEGFNWGGFTLTWIWALGNGVFDRWTAILLLLCFTPYLGVLSAIGLMLYSGFTGNRRAWMAKRWQTQEQFSKIQRRWAILGVAQLALVLVVIVLAPAIYER